MLSHPVHICRLFPAQIAPELAVWTPDDLITHKFLSTKLWRSIQGSHEASNWSNNAWQGYRWELLDIWSRLRGTIESTFTILLLFCSTHNTFVYKWVFVTISHCIYVFFHVCTLVMDSLWCTYGKTSDTMHDCGSKHFHDMFLRTMPDCRTIRCDLFGSQRLNIFWR